MANFQNNAITENGTRLRSHVDMGAAFTATKIVIGSGNMPTGKTARTMTDVVSPVKVLPINKKERFPDGKVVFGGVYTNEDVAEEFYFRELALYAKAVYPDGTEVDEVLYSYGNAGGNAERMAAYSTSTVVERQMDIVTFVGSEAKIDLTIASGLYTSHAEKHAANGEDPITREMIGAAPSGYGLGAEGRLVLDPLSIDASGLYSLRGDNAVNYPAGIPNSRYGVVYAICRANTVHLTFDYLGYIAYANFTIGDTTIVWEYLNPPMQPGIEYRTTERISGKAVYKKNVNGVTLYRLDGETTWKNYATVVGAAPAGFGLGEGPTTNLTPETIDSATKGGWYVYDGVGTKLNNIDFNYAIVRVDVHNDIHSEQFLSPAGSGLWLKRTLKSRAWGEWESVNPPMHNGVEYRTTERIDGKAVYKKNVNGAIQYRLDGETTWKEYAAAVGAVTKTGDQTMTGSLTARSFTATDGIATATLVADGVYNLAQLSVSGPRGSAALTLSPDSLVLITPDGYSYEFIHAGNINDFFGVQAATLE